MVDLEKLNGTAHHNNHQNKAVMKTLTGVTKINVVDIEFENLCYTVKDGFKSETKTILNGISGKFYSGELTAILGPSGSGKSTLLNMLAGYGKTKTTGNIKINDKIQIYSSLHKISAYIMQDIVLQPLLTVKEAMIDEILTVLGLKGCCETMTEQLSGGESRRLSIALELVNNPSVIFLDEPTTGLDVVAMKQCLEALKVLTNEGRTIICSIHQPSASAFMQFDQVYFIANGLCVYNGSPGNTLSYLSSLGLPCPTTYSPAEYIIELVQIHQEQVTPFADANRNGRTDNWHRKLSRPIKNCSTKNGSVLNVYHETTETILDTGFETSFWTQFTVLLGRMMLQQRRNKLSIVIQVMHHLVCGILFGTLFLNIGSNAAAVHQIFGFSTCVMVFFVFTYVMIPVLIFPAEVQLLKREYYNRWYGLKAYYLAMILRSLPVMLSLGLAFLTIVYIMSGQPLELPRFLSFVGSGLLIAIASEGIGLTLGSIFRVTNGAIVGPGISAPMVILSVYGIGYVYKNIALPVRIAMALDYMRFGGSALVLSLLTNREELECFEILCPFKNLNYYLRLIGMENMSYRSQIIPLLGYVIFFKLLGYFVLKCRLASGLSQTFNAYVNSLIRCR